MSVARITELVCLSKDRTTNATNIIDYPHHEIHSGSRFYVRYSVADLGALTTPNDAITLDFTTPDTAKWGHFQFEAVGSGGWQVRLVEAPTGGAVTPTGQLPILNHDRNSLNESTFTDGATAGQVNYDSTLATGGVVLWEDYLPGANTNQNKSGDATGSRDELILKQNTKYQFSIYGTDNLPASLHIDWYEHTNKD